MSRIRANQITNQSADGAPTVQNGLVISGMTTSTTFSGSGASLTNLPAGNLTGTVADARISTLTASKLTGALPALDGSNLTGITQTTINGNADNRVITGSGTANTLEADANLTWNNSTGQLVVGASGSGYISVRKPAIAQVDIQHSTTNSYSRLFMQQSSGSGGYFAINKLGTVDAGYSGGPNAVQLWSSANAPMLFATNNSEKVRITSAGDVAIGRDAALNNYAAGSTTTQLAVVKDGGAAGSGYHEVAHFTGGNDSNDTGAIVRITQFNNDRGLYIKGGRGTGDQAKAIFGLRNSANSDSDVMVFHQGGNVTKPSEVGFHATGSATHTHSSNFVAEFDTEYFDIGGGYNNSNYRFTAPVAGRYFLYFQYLTYPNSDPSYKTFLFRKNGSSSGLYDQGFYRGKEGMQGDQTSQQMSSYIQLAENDYVEPYIELGGGTYKNYMGSGHAHFWGFLIH